MSSNWFVTPRPPRPPGQVRLFCLPYAGGSSAVFRAWSELCPPQVELVMVELPGRGARHGERLARRVEDIAVPLAEAIAARAERPFGLFGHSMGGLLAFHVARELSRQGAPLPAHLFVSAQPPAHLGHQGVKRAGLPDAALRDELVRLGGTPPEILAHAELMTLMLPVLRADFELCETAPAISGQPLACDLTALGGVADPFVDANELKDWAQHTERRFSVNLFPGGHFFLHEHRASLLSLVSRRLLESVRP